MKFNPARSLLCRILSRPLRPYSPAAPNVLEAWSALWSRDRLKTEETLFHELSANPPPSSWTYLAVPWCVLINRGWLPLVRLEPQSGASFTVCQHIAYKKILPLLRKAGVTRLYAAHKTGRDDGVEVLPLPLLPYHDFPTAEKKDILVSFVGCDHRKELNAQGRWSRTKLRRRVFGLADRPGFYLVERRGWHFDATGEANEAAYRSILARSRFSLCPRGTGPNSLRLWESLAAGAIPLLLSDGLTLPESGNVSWDEVIIRIRESELDTVETRIAAISSAEEATRRERCMAIAARFLGPGHLSYTIRQTLTRPGGFVD